MLKEVGKFFSLFHMLKHMINRVLIVSKFAQEVVKPKVSEMDENEKLDASILKALFDQGVSTILDDKRSKTDSNFISLWVLRLMLNMMVPTVLSLLLSSLLKVFDH